VNQNSPDNNCPHDALEHAISFRTRILSIKAVKYGCLAPVRRNNIPNTNCSAKYVGNCSCVSHSCPLGIRTEYDSYYRRSLRLTSLEPISSTTKASSTIISLTSTHVSSSTSASASASSSSGPVTGILQIIIELWLMLGTLSTGGIVGIILGFFVVGGIYAVYAIRKEKRKETNV